MSTGAQSAPRPSWWARLFGQRYAAVEAVAALPADGPVELEGMAEVLDEELIDPLTGESAVAVHVRARIAGAVSRAYGGPAGTSMAFETSCRDQVDFILRDASGGALIRLSPGGDVQDFVAELRRRHGLEAEMESESIPVGARVRVRGRVESRGTGQGPLRGGPYESVIVADEVVRA